MIQSTSPVFANILPKHKLSPLERKIQEHEEIKEIIQNPNDPLAKFPLRAFGYSNEVGAAVSAMPVWGRAAESALWVPALMYLGADIYDKYKKGKEGDYSKASSTAAVQQAIFQALASVILPTAAVKVGQDVAGYTAKFGKTQLTATAQEELCRKLLMDFDKGHFAKADYTDINGVEVKGFNKVMSKVLDAGFYDQMNKTKRDIKTEGIGSKIVRFFGHTHRLVESAKSDIHSVIEYLTENAYNIYNIQHTLENGSEQEIKALNKPKLISEFNKQYAKIEKRAKEFIETDSNIIIRKLLISNNPKHQDIKNTILGEYNTHLNLKALVLSDDLSKKMLEKIISNPENKKTVYEYAKRIETTRNVLRTYLKNKAMKLGVLKTIGGFIALACLAVPIDNFVHKYIIKKFVEPGFENVKNIQTRLWMK